MKNATFYLLDNDTHQDGLSAVEQLVCEIAAERWRAGKRVLIACEDEQQAIRLDEALWARRRRVLYRITCLAKGRAAAHRSR
ncbi:DNA polymerase III subunit chi [Enterobacter cloacae]|uniref:DNA polymerase III subunit chi n=1 Tax=Enterobacter cloacae TaxID=550 RepID=A0A377LUF5_ENTCL|nr:DNA polymerase III subunit chi [Enterobacter cloacae]